MISYRPDHFLFSISGLYQTTASAKGLPLSIRTASGGTGVQTSLMGTHFPDGDTFDSKPLGRRAV